MISKILNVLLVIVAIALISHYFYTRPKFDNGETIPSFQSTLIDGSSFDIAELNGQYVLLDFWGSWCGPCRKDNKKLVELYKAHGNGQYIDASGFEIVSIAIEEKEENWKNAIRQDGLKWRYHIGQLDRFKSPIAQLFGVKEIPTKYLISPEGSIIGVNQNIDEIDNFLDSKKSN